MILGLIGYAKSGKDAAASILVRNGWVRVSFADALKGMVHRATGVNVFKLDGEEKEKIRPVLVELGRYMRSIDPAYWINELVSSPEWASAHECSDNIVITDVRYLNEAKWVLGACSGTLAWIVRPGIEPANDEEEKSLIQIDESDITNNIITIDNSGTVADLQMKMMRLAVEITGADEEGLFDE